MNLSIGIVGLPNVGKSTLFNALTKQQVLAENYPFATIEPNHGVVAVPDERLDRIAEIEKPEKEIYATVDFVDIAGIVKGASEGQGLGNQFLANIREVNAIAQVVRAFEDSNITHVEDSVDPARDIELINTELLLKDMEGLEKKIGDLEKKLRADTKMAEKIEYIKKLGEHVQSGNLAREFDPTTDDEAMKLRRELFLLTDKPIIYIVNSSIGNFEKDIAAVKAVINEADSVIAMDIKIESEIAELEGEERNEFMKEFEMEKSGLETLAEQAYSTLGLISFFTSGPKESRAWTIRQGDSAPEAAGAIHTDFESNFIAADVVGFEDFISENGWQGAREKGKVGLEGKDYIVQDGDVILFKHNA